ncbi:MAG: hypothetical protein LBH11_04870 [Propionibacteriaceae bacterium]|nr:hypothetical protein [Propionibacteriaceae bacterium]
MYRTKRLILEAYDAMAAAIATDQEYRSPFEAMPTCPRNVISRRYRWQHE